MCLYYFLGCRIWYKILSEKISWPWLFPSLGNEIILRFFYSKPWRMIQNQRESVRILKICLRTPASSSSCLCLLAPLLLTPGADSGGITPALFAPRSSASDILLVGFSDTLPYSCINKTESVGNMLGRESREKGAGLAAVQSWRRWPVRL